MTSWLVALNVGILVALLVVLYGLQRRHLSFSTRVLVGLGLGLVLGLALQAAYGAGSGVVAQTAQWYAVVGSGYMRLLQMVALPLVFISILSAFTRLQTASDVGKIGGWVLAVLLVTTGIAAVLGIASTLGFGLHRSGLAEAAATATPSEDLGARMQRLQSQSLPQKFLELIPTNPFLDLTGARPTSVIGVVIFAGLLGIAYLGVKRRAAEQAADFARLVEAIYGVVMGLVRIVLRLTPYGILAVMARAAATSNLQAIVSLGEFVVASYVALAAMFAVHLLILAASGLQPTTYVRKAWPALGFAFSSRSSAATLPLNVSAQRQLGVPAGVADVAASFALSIGQNGCAGIYPAMLAIIAAPAVGIDPTSVSFLVTLVAVVVLSSFGVAGLGGGATFAALLVLSTLNLPVGLVGLLISVEPLIDMGRTLLNVSGSMVAGIVTSRVTGSLDVGVYADRSRTVEVSA
ncbi:L-cystine transporter [Geochorda subterranea]|uniref:L-cystine uptake protein TcyP n=1 Tax=Geochorda subterranea TaxID=3109564 RepID=A0ABZ1BRZ3_9FIRM|nr:cation:dicarboxylase symporter family transporter [Limnochorda sp. LNt]WRP15581.1 cation:dicarboxylase symporter family transporter [Limnochorda sp. LNt]